MRLEFTEALSGVISLRSVPSVPPDLPDQNLSETPVPEARENNNRPSRSKTKLRIKFVDEIGTDHSKEKIWYPTFLVTREDGTQLKFTEFDFEDLELRGFLFLLCDLKTRTIRPGVIQDALNVVKRFMMTTMKLACLEDLQIGIESHQAKINLFRLDLRLPSNFKDDPPYKVIKTVELGMTYPNRKGKMCYFRFSQIARFCDGTLYILRKKLRAMFSQHEKGQN
ncbi:hypothetical protein L6452_09161 [Arctium lappa]|uniref:Uncharacterized protein n=1 Tax=Arctium lappa TaxID=4217 RepID=A0ACB9DJI6_ARCLA|nr:hypothetical protein L6452_09161 [Arctium lappa]